MKTLIEKYKELVELQDKLTDILLSGWNNEDNQTPYPEDLERKIEKIESEIAELEQQNGAELRDYFDLLYDVIPVNIDNCILPDHVREELANIINAKLREQGSNPALREELIAFAEFVNMKMPVITEKYIDEYLSSRQEKPNAKE